MPSSNKDYKYILAVIDAFTKFVWLFPTKSTSADETIKKFEVYSSVFGNPRRIITDRGTAFTATAFKECCKERNIELIQITTGIPRGNGQIERVHRIVISSLAKLSIQNPEKWYAKVDFVQRCLNSTYQRAIQTSPFELLIGTPMKNQLSEIAELIEEEVRNEFKNEREELRIQARDAIQKIQEQNRRNYNAKRKKARKYEVDDLVSIAKTQFATGAKVKPKNIGPYKITKIKANDRYNVEKIGCHEGPGQTSTAADNMKPWPSINIIDLKPSIPKTIVVEGNIGSGKSTLLQYFSRNEKVEIHHEPVQQWQNVNGINLFQMMYSNPEQYGFPFQIYAA